MKEQQSLRQVAVLHPLLPQQGLHHILVTPLGAQRGHALPVLLHAQRVQHVEKGEFLDTVEKGFLERGGRHVVLRVDKREQVLEHPAGRSRCRHELGDLFVPLQVLLPCLHVVGFIPLLHPEDTVTDGGSPHDGQEREPGFKIVQLGIQLIP